MDYQKIYDDLMASRKARKTPDTYHETHHIVPKSLGGDNSKKNLVRLTAREHYIAHFLLAKIHGGNQWWAVKMMSSGASKSAFRHFPTSRQVEHVKKKYSESVRGVNNPFYGKSHSPETLKRIRLKNPAMRGEIKGNLHPNYGRKFGADFQAVLSFITKKEKYKYDSSTIKKIHKAVGLTTSKDKAGRIHRIKSKPLRDLARYFRGVHLGELAKKRDISGKNNPNFGNDKVKGENNGRFNPEIYVWQNKHTGEVLESTCYDCYSKHGMSKTGVIYAISSRRSGVRDWFFLGTKKESVGKIRDISKTKICKTCKEEKPDFGFPKGGKLQCKKCFAAFVSNKAKACLANAP